MRGCVLRGCVAEVIVICCKRCVMVCGVWWYAGVCHQGRKQLPPPHIHPDTQSDRHAEGQGLLGWSLTLGCAPGP